MSVHHVDTLDDPRVAPYRNLKDRELARQGDRFVAEGEHLVRRLLASDFPTESVMVAHRRADEVVPAVPEAVPVYLVPDELMKGVIGFPFHSGVIAVGRRRRLSLDEAIQRRPRLTVVICPETNNTENMGALIRISAAFGADAMVLGERSCDPFFRQSIRVSMGTVFRLPLVQSDDLMRDLHRLRGEYQVELAATVVAEDAEPLAAAGRGPRLGLLLGGEAHGLGPQWVAACDRRITIPMRLGTDSLNVAVAAAVFLYHFTQAGERHD